ncbi:T9SS type A sorting domain-containing protein [Marinoscillum sp.]|uniref:T9SS type A sorting domain-containing protein n=1 Tax=Marinoscillum sp. TaxID=2024838 RepID=UPI003BA8E5EC
MKFSFHYLVPSFILVILCLSPLKGLTQSTSWTGLTDTKWRTSSNWTSGVPDESTDAIIGDANFIGLNQPTVAKGKGTGACKSLTVGNGTKTCTLTIKDGFDISGDLTIGTNGTIEDDGGRLSIVGNWTNSGSYTATGSNRRIYFAGTTQTIGGSTVTNFEKLYINAGSSVTLVQNIISSNFIKLDGTLDPTPNYTVSGTGSIDIESGGILKVHTSTFSGNYPNSGGVNPSKNTAVIDYASSTVNQSIDNAISYRILQISGGMTKSLVGNTTIRNDLIINGGTLDVAAFIADRNNSGGSLVIAGGASLRIGGTSTFPSNYSTHSLATTSTVEYYGANQTVASESYGNLTLSSSSGSVTKTLPALALTIAGNFTGSVSSGTLSFTALNTISIAGNVSLSTSCTFDGSTYTHSLNGNWVNNGTFNGCNGTLNFNGAAATISGSGTNNFGNVVINGSGTVLHENSSLSLCGNFSTANGGSFVHTAGGTGNITTTGTSKTISGANITLNNLITSTGSISTSSTLTIAGDLTVNGPLSASAGNITFSGSGKTISGSSTIQLAGVEITGSLSTARDLLISSNLSVPGTFTATAGQLTFNGTSTFSGTANIYDLLITTTGSLQMGSNAVLGIAGTTTLNAGGTFDATTNVPNTIHYNGSIAQSTVFPTFHNLTLSGGNTKTPSSALTINGDFTLGGSTTFEAGAYTHTIGGDWTNSGTFTANTSTITLNGSNDSQLTGATTFNDLSVNKTNNGEITLDNSINAVNLTMTSGNIITGANSVTLTGNRTGAGLITGTITRNFTYTTAVDYAFEGPHSFINFSSITGSITSITMTSTIGPNSTFASAASINRTYDISVTGSTTYDATLSLHYEQAELNGNVEGAMTFWNDGGTATWVDATNLNTTFDNTDNWVAKSGLTDLLNKWTISEGLVIYSWDGSVDTSWSTADNWTPSGIPGIQDVVHIGDLAFTNQPTISTSENIKKIYFNSTTPGTLTMAPGATLIVQGNVDGIWGADANHIINVGAQTLTTLSDVVLSNGVVNRKIDLNIGTGTVNISGALTQSEANITFTDAGNINIDGDFNYISGTFTPATSTVTFTGSGFQEVGGVTYHDLIIDKPSGTATISAAVTVNNDLTLADVSQVDAESTLTIAGHVNIGIGTILNVPSSSTINLGGNWVLSGSFVPGSGTVNFNGTGAQSVVGTTFNDLSVNKASGTLTLLDDLTINGDVSIQSGTVEVSTYDVSRSTEGGMVSLGAGATARFGGNSLQINNFSNLITDPTSTIEFYTTSSRLLPPVTYGNLTITGGGANAKIMAGPTTVAGTLTVSSGSTLTAPSTTLTLGGNFVMNGTFNASGGTLILDGPNNTIDGDITYEDIVVNGGYDLTSGSAIINGNLEISATGDFDAGTILIVSYGDFTNSGTVVSDGTVTFAGTQTQNIRLLNAITSASTGVVNFNGTVSPTLNSTSSPQFATVNINNTAPIVASQPWTVFVHLNVASGATWDAGPLDHTFYGYFTNNGTVTSDGKLTFSPASAVNINLGTNFTTTKEVEFGGAGLITLTDSNPVFESVTVSNSNAAGLSPLTNWTINQDLLIKSGAQLNGGTLSHAVSGSWTNNGTFNGETSTVTFDSSGGTDAINGSGANNFNNLIFATGTTMDVLADVNITADFTNNGTLVSLIDQLVKFEGSGASILGGTATTIFDGLEIDKSTNEVQMTVNAEITGDLILTNGPLDLNGNTLSITNTESTAVSRTNGYVLSENTSFNSVIAWTISNNVAAYSFPFGNAAGDYIPFVFDLNSGDAGVVSLATYPTSPDNLPLPPGVDHVNTDGGTDNSANTVDRFYLINLAGQTSPNADITFNASAGEVGTISDLLAQRWNGNWESPKAGQTAGATSVTVPGVTEFSPWAISGNSVPLPVELISFKGQQLGSNAHLEWETATERDNDYFEVNKSSDGITFYPIARVQGAGHASTLQHYSHVDQSPTPGVSYYQLRQVDYDGAFSLSKVISVQMIDPDWDMTVYPNPASEFIHLVSSTGYSNEISLVLYDQQGRVQMERTLSEVSANQVFNMDIQALTSGLYILKIYGPTFSKTLKVYIQ